MRAGAGPGPGLVVMQRGERPGLLRAIGEVDASNVDHFASILLAESHRTSLLVLDLHRLRFLGGEGLRAIVRVAGGLHERGGALHLAGSNALVRRMFAVLRADSAPGLVILHDGDSTRRGNEPHPLPAGRGASPKAPRPGRTGSSQPRRRGRSLRTG